MNSVVLALIEFYQRFISPKKGFHCAHHVLHKGDTCSNAVKKLVISKGLSQAWPHIKLRFGECREAYSQLQCSQRDRTDLPCDLPCDIAISDCGSGGKGGSSGNCTYCCDVVHLDGPNFSRRTWRRIFATLLVIAIVASYWFYGRAVIAVELTDTGAQRNNIVSRLTQREEANVKVLITVDNSKFYSDTMIIRVPNETYRLTMQQPPTSFQLDSLTVLDSRLRLINKKIDVSQVLEEFNNVSKQGEGTRFKYRIVRRWHFF